jgi:SpoVK/Ycf46/Vps4 family AAA+-type ATPase
MGFKQEFSLLLKARYPLIYLPTFEEDRIEYTIRKYAKLTQGKIIYTWDFVDGYRNNPNNVGHASRNPLQALEFIEKLTDTTPVIFLLKDFDRFLNDVSISRKLRNLVRILKLQPKTIVLIGSPLTVPEELRDIITIVNFSLPNVKEIEQELFRLFKSLNQEFDPSFIEDLVRSCQGLSLERIRRVLSKIIANNLTIDERSIDLVLSEKKQIISQTQILEFWSAQDKLSDIGGLENLKNWLSQRASSFSSKAAEYGLPFPRGLLLIGIQGTGKSLTAKAIANEWKLPLLRLDFGRLFAGIVGESELKTREMIKLVEAVSPCVLWVDEIDKAFNQSDSKGDSGTTNRVLGTFITWLSEKTSPVFVVATSNSFDTLPLELVRKGRFDETFFVGLPSYQERIEIFKVQLALIRPNLIDSFDYSVLSKNSKNFSGAEIKQSIIEGMHIAFNEDREFTTSDICDAISQLVPLADIENKKMEARQNWAMSGRVRLASLDK